MYGLSDVISSAIWYAATASVSLECVAGSMLKEIGIRTRHETNGSQVLHVYSWEIHLPDLRFSMLGLDTQRVCGSCFRFFTLNESGLQVQYEANCSKIQHA